MKRVTMKQMLLAGMAVVAFATPSACAADIAGTITTVAGNSFFRDAGGDARAARTELPLLGTWSPFANRPAESLSAHGSQALNRAGVPGSSGGGLAGARLYASPFEHGSGYFADPYSAEASGAAPGISGAAGWQARSSILTSNGEFSNGLNDDGRGAAASIALPIGNTFTFLGSGDTSGNGSPLQARLAGIDTRRGSGELIWQAGESRSAAISVTHMDFSDHNRRDITRARWTERMIAGAVYKLEVTGALYASRNSLADASYFNPARDFSPTVEFANEWLQWRSLRREFRHRVVIAAGSYWQQGFGSGSVIGAHYEQEWDAADRLTFRYGVGRTRQPFDGVQTVRNYGYVSLNWRF